MFGIYKIREKLVGFITNDTTLAEYNSRVFIQTKRHTTLAEQVTLV